MKYLGQSSSPFKASSTSPSSHIYRGRNPGDQPKWLWVCAGDINRGSRYEDRPYWWHCGSSYLYPGPTAYLTGDEPLDKLGETRPLKPLTWRNPRRDVLLADHWFDFHSGCRVDHDYRTINPPILVNQMQVKSVNVLFLDLHIQAVTAAQRQKHIKFTIEDDNPCYNPSAVK